MPSCLRAELNTFDSLFVGLPYLVSNHVPLHVLDVAEAINKVIVGLIGESQRGDTKAMLQQSTQLPPGSSRKAQWRNWACPPHVSTPKKRKKRPTGFLLEYFFELKLNKWNPKFFSPELPTHGCFSLAFHCNHQGELK